MACWLSVAKPLSEWMMFTGYELDPQEQNLRKFWKFNKFHSMKCIWKCRPSRTSLNVLIANQQAREISNACFFYFYVRI